MPEKQQPKIPALSRRQFLQITGAALLGTAEIASMGIRPLPTNSKTDVGEQSVGSPKPEIKESETERLMRETEEMKKRFGLVDVEDASWAENKWEPKMLDLSKLDKESEAYAKRAQDVMDAVLGYKRSYLLLGIITGKGFFYHSDSDSVELISGRTMSLSGQYPLYGKGGFEGYCLHEIIGHASDPKHKLYPAEMEIRIQHGKWLMLSQAFEIAGELANHPSDEVLQKIQLDLGKLIAKQVYKNGAGDIVDQSSKEVFIDTLTEFRSELQRPFSAIKFNIKTCNLFGKLLFDSVMDKEMLFSKSIMHDYASNLLYHLAEWYAEAMRISILTPEDMNKTVIAGVKEVLSTLRGEEVDLEAIRQDILRVDPEVIEMQDHVLDMIKKEDKENVGQGPSQPDSQGSDGEDSTDAIWMERLTAFESGTLNSDKEPIKTYADMCYTIYEEYPQLMPGFNPSTVDFDPDMHYWEIEDAERVLDIKFIRRVLMNENFPSERELQDAINALEKVPLVNHQLIKAKVHF